MFTTREDRCLEFKFTLPMEMVFIQQGAVSGPDRLFIDQSLIIGLEIPRLHTATLRSRID